MGQTPWGTDVQVPLIDMVKACGLTTGGTGAGKTMFALLPIQKIIQLMPEIDYLSFGVLDAKGELFDRVLYFLGKRIDELEGERREALMRRIVIIDFANKKALSPYNILARWTETEPDFFITSRCETLRDLLPSGGQLSMRGANILKNVLALLSEFSLPLTYLDRVLSSDEFRSKLLAKSTNEALHVYFRQYFRQEGGNTIAALRARMDSLFASDGVRLALSGATAPDFRRLQQEGKIVLINCAGPAISRGVRLLLQGLVLSDIRQGIFARPKGPKVTYLWAGDEAQNFFLTRQQQENMTDILTMARSFGTFFYFLCQNLSTAIPDSRILETLYTNILWSMTLRSTPKDASFLRSAFPVTGRKKRPEMHPFREATIYSPEEERSLALSGVANLPNREGYLWLKTRSPEAIQLRTAHVELADDEEFQEYVDRVRHFHALGNRMSKNEYERMISKRDREWLENEPITGDLGAKMEEEYADIVVPSE